MAITASIQYDELLEKCKQGDSKSLAELYQKYSRTMYNTCLRIVNNSEDAEEVLQDVFIDAFSSLKNFQYKSSFGTWLKRIAINKSISFLRRKKIPLSDIDETTDRELPTDEATDEDVIRLKVEEIKKAMTLLPNGYRTTLTLYFFEGYDHEEIAEILNLS
ncbi:MAG: RNA polymerase sigma factor, partial [Chitinophagaceae bacterium]|nr:RNA polymerase sigma factor [Chitinophagaceae bacterium]